MVRLADLPEIERGHHLDRVKQIPHMSPPRLVSGPPLNQRRVALITTAGLHTRTDTPFNSGKTAAIRAAINCPRRAGVRAE